MVCVGYVKYEEAEVDRSAIKQDFRDNEKKTIKNCRLAAILNVISAKFVMDYLCVMMKYIQPAFSEIKFTA